MARLVLRARCREHGVKKTPLPMAEQWETSMSVRFAASAICAIVPLGAAASVVPIELASHRAAYELALYDGGKGSAAGTVNGLLVMELQSDCLGHVTNQELAFVADLDGSGRFNYVVRFTSWESRENDSLRFDVRTYDDGTLFEEYRGRAAIGKEGSVADYEKPKVVSLQLPEDTIFPTEHMRRLIETAQNGETMLTEHVFDGSGPDSLTAVSAIIGRPESTPSSVDHPGSDQRWPVSLAYYPMGDDAVLPDYEVAFDMTSSGILHDIVLDYGDFALVGTLTELELFDTPNCP